MKIAIAALVVAMLAGCASAPMNRTALRQHAERNCRVSAAVSPSYHVDSTGVDTHSTAFAACMASRGFVAGR